MKSFLANKKRGMSLPEVMVVVGIIVVLSTIAYSKMTETRKDARNAVRIRDAQQIAKQIDLYLLENKQFPDAGTNGLAVSSDWGTFLSNSGFTLPLDPKNGQPIPMTTVTGGPLNDAFTKYQYVYLQKNCTDSSCDFLVNIDPAVVYFPLEGKYQNSPRCENLTLSLTDFMALIVQIDGQTSGASVTCKDIAKGGCFVQNGSNPNDYTNWACVKSGFESN